MVIVVRVAGWGGVRARPMEGLKIGHKIKPVSKKKNSSRARGESRHDAANLLYKTINAMPVFSRHAIFIDRFFFHNETLLMFPHSSSATMRVI